MLTFISRLLPYLPATQHESVEFLQPLPDNRLFIPLVNIPCLFAYAVW